MRLHPVLLLVVFLLTATAPVRAQIGVVTAPTEGRTAADSEFARGAQLALDERNKMAIRGKRFSLLPHAARTAADAETAVAALKKSGALVVAADYVGDDVLAALRAACKKQKLPLIEPFPDPEELHAAVLDFIVDRLRVDRLALISGKGKEAGALKKLLKKADGRWQGYAMQTGARFKQKKIIKKLSAERIEAVLIDGSHEEAVAALAELGDACKLPVFLTPRSYRPGMDLKRTVFPLLGRSPLTHPLAVEFRALYKEKFSADPQLGCGEGYDAAALFLESYKSKDTLSACETAGPRGKTRLAVKGGSATLHSELALWRSQKDGIIALLPGPEDSGIRARNDQKKRVSVPRYGAPMGADMSNRFQLEPGTRWVLFTWGDPGQATIDQDLKLLGLSSGGQCPLADHIVKKELLGRAMAITSMKFLRLPNGTSRPGESFAISFATALPPKGKKGGNWKVIIAGDDPDAGGRAYPGSGLAFTFSTFLRRTIYQVNAIDPPLHALDLPGLLGCKTQDEFNDDDREKMIHALIDGYAGGMALTTAHEVGHLAGLGHILDDPRGIMNVNEGAGLDYRHGRFSDGNKGKLIRTLGIVKKNGP